MDIRSPLFCITTIRLLNVFDCFDPYNLTEEEKKNFFSKASEKDLHWVARLQYNEICHHTQARTSKTDSSCGAGGGVVRHETSLRDATGKKK